MIQCIQNFPISISGRCPANRNDVYVAQSQSCTVEAVVNSEAGESREVLDPVKTFFSDCSYRNAVDQDRG